MKVTGTFPDRAPIGARFTGELTAVQARAVEAMTAHPTGVLVAQPGAGKTVMACALIAVHARPTAIIVNRAELLAQWRERLEAFLDLGEHAVGSLGAGKDRRGGVVDLIMLQSLAHPQASALPLRSPPLGRAMNLPARLLGDTVAAWLVEITHTRQWLSLSDHPLAPLIPPETVHPRRTRIRAARPSGSGVPDTHVITARSRHPQTVHPPWRTDG